MTEFMMFFGTIGFIGVLISLSVACYHWGRFEGEIMGRNRERQERDHADIVRDATKDLE